MPHGGVDPASGIVLLLCSGTVLYVAPPLVWQGRDTICGSVLHTFLSPSFPGPDIVLISHMRPVHFVVFIGPHQDRVVLVIITLS